MKILYFGNPYIKEDSLAITIAKILIPLCPNIEFQYIKDTFQLMDMDIKDTILLDVADNAKSVQIVDADKIKSRALSSLHDFDLGFFLNLSETKVKIIVIPIGYNENRAIEEVKYIIDKLI